ncbi:hypothetical protein AURDEDRAFT_85175 [Auricularia subglabra TFB-10046 SS5]|nr:hypothetical protein AURDEDRAFT_85175 [Auricularia subglabra TFB-10046 SS5]
MLSIVSTAVLALAASVIATPLRSNRAPRTTDSIVNTFVPPPFGQISFNNWGNFQCVADFDSFYGLGNFGGHHNVQTVLTQVNQVCEVQTVSLVQQQLAIIAEYAKRVITTALCSSEVQAIVFEQWLSSIGSFSGDLRHISGRTVGYDHIIAGHIGDLIDVHGNINFHDFGFKGVDIGQNVIHVSGGNWVNGISEQSVQQAFFASQVASLGSLSTFGGFPGTFITPTFSS